MELTDNIRFIKGVGESLAKLYARLGIETVKDLIYHYPRRYEDYSRIVAIRDIKPGQVTLEVEVKSVASRYVRRGLHITEALISDDTGSIKVVWFNQPYREKAIKVKTAYFVSGEYAFHNNRYSIVNPSMEQVSAFPKNTARIVPIYPETKGLKSHQIRKSVEQVLPLIDTLPDPLPQFVVEEEALLSHSQSIRNIHFPKDSNELEKAKARIGFEELFELTLAALLNKQAVAHKTGTPIAIDSSIAKDFAQSLPFKLTNAQRRVAWQVLKDMSTVKPMNRLVEGDVGSGKTIVAAFASLMTVKTNKQVAYMAPTEILARQQYETLSKLLSAFGVRTELFIGGMSAVEKAAIGKRTEAGETDLVIGTHALIQRHPKFQDLSLVVIDEQHRFGVNQREKLLGKAKRVPHVLTMTATPIPRSLALTVYGELDISIIDEVPPGRPLVKTQLASTSSRAQLYNEVDSHITAGRQVYVICPLVDESDTLGVKSVNEEFKLLNTGSFKHRRIGLMHGQLATKEKEQIMRKFNDGDLDILVSTTVVEVGVNVPNATIMIIEGAERFGLAQLHQLRGRVRRSSHQPYCYVVPSPGVGPTKRLRMFTGTSDGFALAELDLQLRGPGQIYGTAQHGALDLSFAKLTDAKLIARARRAAARTIELEVNLLKYPRLIARINVLRKITNLN